MGRNYRVMRISPQALAGILRDLRANGLIRLDLPDDFDFTGGWHDWRMDAIGVYVSSKEYEPVEENMVIPDVNPALSVEPGRNIVTAAKALLAQYPMAVRGIVFWTTEQHAAWIGLEQAVKEVERDKAR